MGNSCIINCNRNYNEILASDWLLPATILALIVHSTKLLNSDWLRAVQLIPNSTRQEYLLSSHGDFESSQIALT